MGKKKNNKPVVRPIRETVSFDSAPAKPGRKTRELRG